MAEKNTTVASSVEADGTVTSVNQPEVVDIIGGAGDTVQSTEEKIPTGELSKYLLAGTITSTEGAKSTTEKTNSPAEETIASTKKTSSPTEETIPAAETIPCIKETSPPTEKATASAQGISYPTEEIIPRTEEAYLPPEVATPPAQKTGSSAEETMPFTVQTSFPTEQTVALAEKIIISTEKTNQPTEEMVSPTEEAILSAGETVIPTVKTIQDGNPESELVTSCPLIEQEIMLENSPLENTADGERSESVPAVEEVIPLPTEEAYKENGKADGNVKEDHDADDNGDDTEADEEIYSEEFQQENDSLESPSTSPIFSSQPESPTNTDSAEQRPGASRRPDITKHSYSRYNTVSYRKIRKGNTKQRIDEFESMLHIN